MTFRAISSDFNRNRSTTVGAPGEKRGCQQHWDSKVRSISTMKFDCMLKLLFAIPKALQQRVQPPVCVIPEDFESFGLVIGTEDFESTVSQWY